MILIAVRTEGLKQLAADLKVADRKAPGRLAKRLKEAGEVVAVDARQRASWSSRIPGTIRVTGGARSVSVFAGSDAAPHAAPYEGPEGNASFRHPVFGHRRNKWVTQQTRPYLRTALDAQENKVAEIVGKVVDDIIRDAGL